RGANGVVIITTKKGQVGRPSLSLVSRVGTQQLAKSYNMRCFTYDQAAQISKSVFKITLTPDMYGGCIDEQKLLYDNHQLSYDDELALRGGNQSTTYYASAGITHDGGLAVNSDYTKQSLHLNLNQLLGNSLSF